MVETCGEMNTESKEKNIYKLAETYDFTTELKIGSFLDSKDTSQTWCLAEVIQVYSWGGVRVHYEGWSDSYDADFRFSSYRIAPLRQLTRGYTGQKSRAIRHLSINSKLASELTEMTNKLADNDFMGMDTETFNQLVRGKLFVWIDYAMTNFASGRTFPKADLDFVLTLDNAVLKLICKWLSSIDKRLTFYAEVQLQPKLALVSTPHAVAACFPELADMLKLLFGFARRCDQSMSVSSSDRKGIPNFYKTNVITFQNYNGFELVKQLVTLSGEKEFSCPFQILLDFLEPSILTLDQLADESSKNLLTLLEKCLKDRVKNLSDKDIKEINKFSIDKLYCILEVLKPPKESKDSILEVLFGIAMQLVKSSLIQKKMLGIELIKQMIPKNVKDKMFYIDQSIMVWKDQKLLGKTMADHKFLEFIMGENAHPELLRQISDILQHCLIHGVFEAKHLQLLWKCCTEKHEDIIRVSFQLLTSILPEISYQNLEFLFSLIEKHTAFSEIFVSFIEKYTITVLSVIHSLEYKNWTKQKYKGKPPNIYNLDILWNLMQDSTQVAWHIKEHAMESLIRILNKYQGIADHYVNRAAESIKNQRMVIRGLQLLLEIDFADYNILKDGRHAPYYNLKEMNQSNNLIQNAIKDCEIYHSFVKKELEKFPEKTTDLMNIDFGTGLTFKKQSKLYIDFIEYYSSRGDISMTKEELSKLWKCYVEESMCELHSNTFFTALVKEKRPFSTERKFCFFNDKNARIFFDEILCSQIHSSVSKLTMQGFVCFKIMLLWLNEREVYNLKRNDPSVKLRSPLENYIGIQTLWTISLSSDMSQIQEQAKTVLVNIISKLCLCHKTRRKEITEKALEVTLSRINDFSQVDQMLKALNIIDSLIDKIECLSYEQVSANYFLPTCIEFSIYTDLSKKPEIVKINQDLRISNLKNLLSNLFKIHKSRIVIKSVTTKIELDSQYDYYLHNLKRLTENKILVEFKKSDIPETETPRYILANSKLFNTLLKLFQFDSEKIANGVWNLLTFIPLNEEVKNKIKTLNFEETSDLTKSIWLWAQYLEIPPNYDSTNLTYYLYSINDLLSSKTILESEKQKFLQKFEKKRGLCFISDIFVKKNGSGCTRTRSNLKCIEYCMKIITYLIENNPKNLLNCGVDEGTLWNYVQGVLKWINESKESDIEKKGEANLIEVCLGFEKKLISSKNIVKELRKESYLEIIQQCLLKHSNDLVRNNVANFLEDLILNLVQDSSIKQEFMNNLVNKFIFTSISEGLKSQQYFQSLAIILTTCPEYLSLLKQDTLTAIISEILHREIFEKTIRDCDFCLGGLLTVLRLIFIHNLHKNYEIDKESLIQGLLDSLFRIESSFPKCKHEDTRKKALLLLEQLLISSFTSTEMPIRQIEIISKALNFLTVLHTTGNWRSNRKCDWTILAGDEQKLSKFVGLKNLGATCYLNSSLQQLFMIPHFRKGIIEANHPALGKEESMLFQLQTIFSSLQNSQRAVYNPRAFTQVFKIDGRILNVIEQKDVDEFITHLLDQVEESLKSTNSSTLVKDTFKLTLANEIICKDCPHKSEKKEEAISLILSVKNKKNLNESLKAFVQADTLEGENAYLCERCDKKIPALKRTNIKTLPNVLIIVLKRFEFNLETFTRYKVNDYCEFPDELDMKEFTQEGQSIIDIKKDIEAGKTTLDQLSEEQQKLLQRKIPNDYYRYRLKGIIIHSGYLDGGHYYSFIQDREQSDTAGESSWFEFNDSIVQGFDRSKIPDEAFGGVEELPNSSSVKRENLREKSRNAYVLIYERVVPFDAQKLENYKEEESEIDLEEVNKRFEQMKIEVSNKPLTMPKIIDYRIEQDNKKFWLTHYIFNTNYHSFLTRLFTQKIAEDDTDYLSARSTLDNTDIEIFQHEIKFLLTTGFRAYDKSNVPTLLKHIKESCKKNVKLCLWIAKLFSHKDVITEMLTDNPINIVRRWIVELLQPVMQQLFLFEKDTFKKMLEVKDIFSNPKIFLNFFNISGTEMSSIELKKSSHSIPFVLILINNVIQQLEKAPQHHNGCLCEILCHFATLGEEAVAFLNSTLIIKLILDNLIFGEENCELKTKLGFTHINIDEASPLGINVTEHVYMSKKSRELTIAEQSTFLLNLLFIILKLKNLKKAEDITANLSPIEIKYIKLLQTEKVLDSILEKCWYHKAALNLFAKIIALLCYDNEPFTHSIMKYTLLKFKEQECERLRLYFRITHALLQNKDKLVNKTENYVSNISLNFKTFSNIYRIAECYIDFIIKECRTNDIFLNILKKMPEGISLLESMERWLRDNPCPLPTFGGQIFKSKPDLKMTQSFSFSIQDKYKMLSESRREALRQIKRGKVETEYDSEDDMYSTSTKIEEGSTLDLNIGNCLWVPSVVSQSTESVFQLEYTYNEEKKKEWVEIDSDMIAPANTLIKNLRRHLASQIDLNLHLHK